MKKTPLTRCQLITLIDSLTCIKEDLNSIYLTIAENSNCDDTEMFCVLLQNIMDKMEKIKDIKKELSECIFYNNIYTILINTPSLCKNAVQNRNKQVFPYIDIAINNINDWLEYCDSLMNYLAKQKETFNNTKSYWENIFSTRQCERIEDIDVIDSFEFTRTIKLATGESINTVPKNPQRGDKFVHNGRHYQVVYDCRQSGYFGYFEVSDNINELFCKGSGAIRWTDKNGVEHLALAIGESINTVPTNPQRGDRFVHIGKTERNI